MAFTLGRRSSLRIRGNVWDMRTACRRGIGRQFSKVSVSLSPWRRCSVQRHMAGIIHTFAAPWQTAQFESSRCGSQVRCSARASLPRSAIALTHTQRDPSLRCGTNFCCSSSTMMKTKASVGNPDAIERPEIDTMVIRMTPRCCPQRGRCFYTFVRARTPASMRTALAHRAVMGIETNYGCNGQRLDDYCLHRKEAAPPARTVSFAALPGERPFPSAG